MLKGFSIVFTGLFFIKNSLTVQDHRKNGCRIVDPCHPLLLSVAEQQNEWSGFSEEQVHAEAGLFHRMREHCNILVGKMLPAERNGLFQL